MAHAGTHRPAGVIHAGISRADAQAGHTVRARSGVERHTVLRFHSYFDCRLRCLFRALRPWRSAGSDDYSDCPASRLLLFVAVRTALFPSSVSRDTPSAHRSSHRAHSPTRPAVSITRTWASVEA